MKRKKISMPGFSDKYSDDNNIAQFLEDDMPQAIKDYLAKLKLLVPLPASYLFADIIQFPEESLRFFYVDENWTNALTDGAMSIGRGFSDDIDFERTYAPTAAVYAHLNAYRRRLDNMHDNHKNERVMKKYGVCMKHADNFRYGANTEPPMTGFIMRSELVQYLKGLEIEGKDAAGNDLPLLRLDTLTDTVLIGIWSGEVANFTVKEPKTALHFGYNDVGLELKHTDTEHLGEYYKDKSPIAIPVNTFRRVDVTALAKIFADELGDEITPAVFAFELMTVENIAEYTAKENKS
ncbi:MAG: hypothetical protein LBL98_04610 [Ruminococcus sp.]|nr:hypothetical protein [Ruminococcus sp.]